MIRSIKINIHEDLIADMNLELKTAIGYLTTWGNAPKVSIFFDKEGYGEASYIKEDGSICYVIGAVLDKVTGKYSFHS